MCCLFYVFVLNKKNVQKIFLRKVNHLKPKKPDEVRKRRCVP